MGASLNIQIFFDQKRIFLKIDSTTAIYIGFLPQSGELVGTQSQPQRVQCLFKFLAVQQPRIIFVKMLKRFFNLPFQRRSRQRAKPFGDTQAKRGAHKRILERILDMDTPLPKHMTYFSTLNSSTLFVMKAVQV
jgi:hypothetical protein